MVPFKQNFVHRERRSQTRIFLHPLHAPNPITPAQLPISPLTPRAHPLVFSPWSIVLVHADLLLLYGHPHVAVCIQVSQPGRALARFDTRLASPHPRRRWPRRPYGHVTLRRARAAHTGFGKKPTRIKRAISTRERG